MFRFNISEVLTNLYLRCTLAGLSIDESSPELFILNIDCLEEIFEWLSLSDLLALRETCKQLRQVVNYYIKANYPTVDFGYKKICLFPSNFENFNTFDAVTVNAIRRAHFWTVGLDSAQIRIVKNIFPKLEQLLIGWPTEGDFYEDVLQYCPSVKYISMVTWNGVGETENGNQWLTHQYSKLEHFLVNDFDCGGPDETWKVPLLKTFFQQNSNIRIFSTSSQFFRRNEDCWLNSNIKLDRLEISGFTTNINRICDLLKTLYDQGFYKHIHIYIMLFSRDFWGTLSEIKGLELLYLRNSASKESLILPPMNELKELAMNYAPNPEDLKVIAQNLTSVERIYVGHATINQILPFIQYAQNVNKIGFYRVQNENSSEKTITIDLSRLNEYRKGLVGASKVTIYVPENVYLDTKWNTCKTDYSLVELKRVNSLQWEHLFF